MTTLPPPPPVRAKTNPGRFFEDFHPGQEIIHPLARTLTEGDHALYLALTGSRSALFCDWTLASRAGLPWGALDPLLAFHMVFGKSVADISLNAVANLGYADGRFLAPVACGDTLRALSHVLGVKENSNGRSGIVYVRTEGLNQRDERVLTYVRWVMIAKRTNEAAPGSDTLPDLPASVPADALSIPAGLRFKDLDPRRIGTDLAFEDYSVGEKIDHVEAMAVEEAEHQIATRLYQNNARVHFDRHGQAATKLGVRLIYGGVVISLGRALSFNGLAGAGLMLAINGGRHVNPLLAGDTLYAWSEVLDKAALREDVGALRLRLVALRNRPAGDFTATREDGSYDPSVVLDFDYWAAMPTRAAFR